MLLKKMTRTDNTEAKKKEKKIRKKIEKGQRLNFQEYNEFAACLKFPNIDKRLLMHNGHFKEDDIKI